MSVTVFAITWATVRALVRALSTPIPQEDNSIMRIYKLDKLQE